jgi:hypothetical protein
VLTNRAAGPTGDVLDGGERTSILRSTSDGAPGTTGSPAEHAIPLLRRPMTIVLLTVLVASLWPMSWVASRGGDMTALLCAGKLGPSIALVRQDMPDARLLAGVGHDGQQFYAVARHRFDPEGAKPYLGIPAYRERRILFPLLAGTMAPGGGRPLILAFGALSLIGVALAAWACMKLPGAPRWLPLTVALTPGIGAALFLSLADALATGLCLAALATAMAGRWKVTVLALVLATLTRETSLVFAVAIAAAPGLRPSRRLATIAIPAAIIAMWSLWSSAAVGGRVSDGPDQFSLPFVGWFQSPDTVGGIALGVGTMLLLVAALAKDRSAPLPVKIVIGMTLAMSVVMNTEVTMSWVNTGRIAAPAVPLAIWLLVRRPDPDALDGRFPDAAWFVDPPGVPAPQPRPVAVA